MQPTKKKAIAKWVLTALTIASSATTCRAVPYEPSPLSLGSARVETALPFEVRSSLMTPTVMWDALIPQTSTKESLIGYITVNSTGPGIAPAAYLIEPCGGASDYHAIGEGKDGAAIGITIKAGEKIIAPHSIINADLTDKHAMTVKLVASQLIVPGMFATCLSVMGIADDVAGV